MERQLQRRHSLWMQLDGLSGETLDAGRHRDQVVSMTANLRFKLQEYGLLQRHARLTSTQYLLASASFPN